MIKFQQIKAEDTYEIRKEELRKGMDLSSQFTGDMESGTMHFGLIYKDELVSIVSFMKSKYKDFEGEHYQLRGMATQDRFQGKGFGKILMERSEELLKRKGISIIWCNARVVALDFYKKIGYKITGNEFDIPPIGGHFVMYKVIQ